MLIKCLCLLITHGAFSVALGGAPVRSASAMVADDPYVEFDFTTLPEDVGRKWSLKLKVSTSQAGTVYEDQVGPVDGYLERFGLCEALASRMKKAGFKVEVIDKAKLRVYGRTHEKRFYLAAKGFIDSKELKKDELPTATDAK